MSNVFPSKDKKLGDQVLCFFLQLSFLLPRIQRESIAIIKKLDVEILMNFHVADLPESERTISGIRKELDERNLLLSLAIESVDSCRILVEIPLRKVCLYILVRVCEHKNSETQ
ncbi:hypothetical protein AVEN_10411-1 [Araneus ventricosus]|uniref:Uncharacterized protein n=1 Tax=Araneus ventricosus TaxID=182803 RepID=A0A4Y2J0V7_ARAVE|nr:hypothetical protein AVEN_10411-1 [Araneus ventricosus]